MDVVGQGTNLGALRIEGVTDTLACYIHNGNSLDLPIFVVRTVIAHIFKEYN